jgi:hypothetical protein
MITYEAKMKIILGAIGFSILIAVGIINYKMLPSDSDLEKKQKEFYTILNNKNIKRIFIYVKDEYGKGYKLEIIDKAIIDLILNASQKNYHKIGIRGGFAQYYLIRLNLGKEYYNFGYAKMDKYDLTDCQSFNINYYNDCGRVLLYRYTNLAKEFEPTGPAIFSVMHLININLITVLREYVDKNIKENPEKYQFKFEDN